MDDTSLRLQELVNKPEEHGSAERVWNEILQTDVEDHAEGKKDQQIFVEESDWGIGWKTRVSSGDYQEKNAQVLQILDKETIVG